MEYNKIIEYSCTLSILIIFELGKKIFSENQTDALAEQVRVLTEKLSALESKIETKEDLKEQYNSLKEEVSALKKDMVSKNDMKINFTTMKGSSISLYATKSDTVKLLKSKLQEKENTPQEQLYLFLDGKLLEDNLTIEQCNIKESSKVFLLKEKDEFLNIVSCKERMFFIDSLEKNVDKKIRKLLYNPRNDGDDANTFHKNCDNQGPLLYVIVATNNSVFGIYVSKPISSDGNTRTDSLQMVISPTHNFSTKSKNDKSTYHCVSGKGPQFHCMQINAPFLTSTCTDIQSCSDFNLPCYPTGNSSYQIKEFEVYSLVDVA